MANYNVTNYNDIIAAINSAKNSSANDNLIFQNDLLLTSDQALNLMTPANSGNLRFRSMTGTYTLTVQSDLNINDNAPSTPQPSFTIGPFALQIGNGGTAGSLTGNLRVDDGGVLIFNRSVDTLYTGTLSVEDDGDALLNNVAGTTVTFDGTAGTNGLAIRASQNTGAANPYELEIGGAGDGVISGIIGDGGLANAAGDLTKTGSGTWTFSGVNTYVGSTTVSEGVLNIRSASGLGATIGSGTGASADAAGTVVEDGATLALQAGTGNGIAIGAEALTLAGEGVGETPVGALENVSGDNSFAGNITLTADTLITSQAGSLTLSGSVGGAFGLTLGGDGNGVISGAIGQDVTTLDKEGDGTWLLSGGNAYAGGSTLDDGTLELGSLSSAGTGSITFGADAQTLQLDVSGTLSNSLVGFGVEDTIDLRAIDPNKATLSVGDGTVTVTEDASVGSDSNTLTLDAAPTGYRYALGSDGSGGTTLFLQDAVPPNTPPAPTLTAASDTGISNSDDITKRVRPVLAGTAEAGSTVTLYDGTTSVGTAVADGSGNYTVAPTDPLSDGDHTLRVTATDAAGNTSALSDGLTVSIDTVAPTQLAAPALTAASDTGRQGDGITSVTNPTFTGTAEKGSTVTFYDGIQTRLGSTTAGSDGSYSFTVSLSEGTHSIRANATDVAGNTSQLSPAQRVVIDTTAPATPAAPVLSAASDTGASNSDGITRDATPTFTGRAEAGSTVTLYDGQTSVGTATANSKGTYSVTASTLGDGDHNLSVTLTDAAGNQSIASNSTSVTIDTKAPGTPATPALDTASDSGASHTDGLTNDTTPTFVGTAEAGSTVTLYDGITKVIASGIADESGHYSIEASLGEGAHGIRVRATDTAGNVSAFSGARRVVIDTQTQVAITSDGGTVDQARQTIRGTGEFGAKVTLTDENGKTLGTTTVASNGTWSRAVTLSQGDNDITATAVDKAGNSATSNEVDFDYQKAASTSFAAASPRTFSFSHTDLAGVLFNAAFSSGHIDPVPLSTPPSPELFAPKLASPV